MLLQLHNSGMHSLQLFLQEHTGNGDFDQCFNEEIEFFRTLGLSNENTSAFSDIFPDGSTDMDSRTKTFEILIGKNPQKPDFFPIFSCNSEFLKAVFAVLQQQVQEIEELQREKEELLSIDASCLGLPSFNDVGIESARNNYYEARASSRTTMNRSPYLNNRSPNQIDLDFYKKSYMINENDESQDEENEKIRVQQEFKKKFEYEERILKEKQEIEAEKQKLEYEKKSLEEKMREIIEKESVSNRKTKKIWEKIEEKNQKLIQTGIFKLLKLFCDHSIGPAFIKINKFSDSKKGLIKEKYKKSVAFFNKKLVSKCFLALRYNQIILKTKKIKANDFYKGRLLLDSFYAWKKFFVRRKSSKTEKTEKKITKKLKKSKSRKSSEHKHLKSEFEKLLKKLSHSDQNIKEL